MGSDETVLTNLAAEIRLNDPRSQSVANKDPMPRNAKLHQKLDQQIAAHHAKHGYDPTSLHLTHDEIDEWRAQFTIVIPVDVLAYRGIPIAESTSLTECQTSPVSSRVCERGTRCCVIRHEKQP